MALGAIQFGVESVPGTAVPATAILEDVGSAEWGDDLVVDQPELLDGTYALHSNGTTLGKIGRLALRGGILDFEQLPFFLANSIKSLTPSGDAGTPIAYTWLAEPTLTADDTPKAATFEAKNDTLVEEMEYGITERFRIGVSGPRARTDFEADIFGRQWTATTLTAALSHVATEAVKGTAWLLKLDDSGGTIGTTAYAGCLKGFQFDSGLLRAPYECLANSEVFTGIARPKMEPSLTVRVAVDATLADVMADWRAGTRQLIELSAEGSTIHAAVKKKVRIQMAGRITAMSRVGATMEQEQWIREITFMGERDTAWGKLFGIQVINDEDELRGAA